MLILICCYPADLVSGWLCVAPSPVVAEAAKLQRRRPAPRYGERVYDTVSRCIPTSLERKLYAKVLQKKQFWVRKAARLVAYFV